MPMRNPRPLPRRDGARRRGAAAPFAALCVLAFAGGLAGAAELKKPARPTFTKDVAPILQKRCQVCHRAGSVGPFALETYAQARKRASDIAAVAVDRSMPPWKPAPGIGPKLKHEGSLTADEVAVLKAWAVAGAPEGDPSRMPPPRSFPDGWTLGTPDLVLEVSEEFVVPASGPDVYRCFVLPTRLSRDVHISAVEFRPGNRRVVHHVMAFIDVEGGGRERDASEEGSGYVSFSGAGVETAGDLGGWTAGNAPNHLPEGVGSTLPSRADVIIQVHYHPNGKPESDRTRIGLYLCKKPVRQTLVWNNASSYDMKIPAGQDNVEAKASWFVTLDVEALAVTPHMHLLGRDFRMSATFPSGKTRDLIYIPDWDPNWQSTYFFEEAVTLPKGTTVKVVAHFDNTAHARNPNHPPKLVKWGPGVADEMCVGYIGVVKKGQDLTQAGEKDDLYDIFVKQKSRTFQKEFDRQRR